MFVPLRTLCPSCARNEIETFEKSVVEKWASRCGWDEGEWNGWLNNAVKDRRLEQEFWEKAQERVVREKEPAGLAASVSNMRMEVEKCVERKGRKSIFRKLFSGVT
jgi:hypothetical protein